MGTRKIELLEICAARKLSGWKWKACAIFITIFPFLLLAVLFIFHTASVTQNLEKKKSWKLNEIVEVAGARPESKFRTCHPRCGGWKNVLMFVGDEELEEMHSSSWHAQVGQDRYILEKVLHGKKHGFYVDLAANDAVRISNTFSMEKDFLWDGLCIEANPRYLWRLALRSCSTIYAAVGGEFRERVEFHMPFGENEGGFGGIVSNFTDNHPGKQKHSGISLTLPTVSLEEVFLKMNVPDTVDYFSIDVEGAEEMILHRFPFQRYLFFVITIERPSRLTHRQLREEGYTFVAMLGNFGDCMYVHSSIQNYSSILAATQQERRLTERQRKWKYVLE